MLVKQFASGGVITVNGAPHIIESVEKHTPSARGAATIYKVRCRNLLTQMKTDLSCKGEDSYDEPDFRQQEVQYLYKEGNDYVFMDVESFEQFPLAAIASLPDGPYRMDDIARGKLEPWRDDGAARVAVADLVAGLLQLCKPCRPENRTADTAPGLKTFIGGVDDGVGAHINDADLFQLRPAHLVILQVDHRQRRL